MEWHTNKIKYSILAGLAAYGTYHLVFDVIGVASAIQGCYFSPEGTISAICHIFGVF